MRILQKKKKKKLQILVEEGFAVSMSQIYII